MKPDLCVAGTLPAPVDSSQFRQAVPGFIRCDESSVFDGLGFVTASRCGAAGLMWLLTLVRPLVFCLPAGTVFVGQHLGQL